MKGRGCTYVHIRVPRQEVKLEQRAQRLHLCKRAARWAMREREQATLVVERRRDLRRGVDEVCTEHRRAKVEAHEELGEVLADEREVGVIGEEVACGVRNHGQRHAKERVGGVDNGRVAECSCDAEVGDVEPLVSVCELDETREDWEHRGIDATGRRDDGCHGLRLAWADGDTFWEDGDGCGGVCLWDGPVVREAGSLYTASE